MLNSSSHTLWHVLQNVSLVLLSLAFLIPDLCVIASCYGLQILISSGSRRRARSRKATGFQSQNVLVTGLGMAKGLAIARSFYLAGHDVVGADFEPENIKVNGRYSMAIKRFYHLPLPAKCNKQYEEKMINIIRENNIDLWVSCSGVVTAIDDARMSLIIRRETSCQSIQLSEGVTAILDDKGRFSKLLKALKFPAPESYVVRSRDEIHKTLSSYVPRSKLYILKSIAINDASRDSLTKLPMSTSSATYEYVSKIDVNSQKPYILQEFISGTEYCTHALVINNTVETFVACCSSDLLMHYRALPTSSSLHGTLLKFTQDFVRRTTHELTGHLSFDFIVGDHSPEGKNIHHLYPIECNPRAHTALTLFQGLERTIAWKYLAALTPSMARKGTASKDEPVFPRHPKPIYWLGHDLVTLVIYPILCLISFRLSPRSLIKSLGAFLRHLLFWKEGTFEIWDPLPFFWLYHVYWPLFFYNSILYGRWWSRVNVSTTKRFAVE